MKRNQKQKLIAEKAALNDKIDSILEEIGIEKMYEHITDMLDRDIEYTENQIEDEQAFADENRSGAYRSAGTEARKRVKYLKGVLKKNKEVLKMFNDFLKMKEKVDKL